jgi:hypothetical protein
MKGHGGRQEFIAPRQIHRSTHDFQMSDVKAVEAPQGGNRAA